MKEYQVTKAAKGYVVKQLHLSSVEDQSSYGTLWAFTSALEVMDFLSRNFDESPLILNPEPVHQLEQNSDYSNEEYPDVVGDLPY